MSNLHIDAVWVRGDTIRVILLEEAPKRVVAPAIPEKPLFSDGHGLPCPVDELPKQVEQPVDADNKNEPLRIVMDLTVGDLLRLRKNM